MADETPQALLNALIKKGNELISLTKQSCIYCASVAYMAQHIYSFLICLKDNSINIRTPNQLQILHNLLELFTSYGNVLHHFSETKWIQPALNWPVDYTPDYIMEIKKFMFDKSTALGIDPSKISQPDQQQERVNYFADIKSLKLSLENLQTQIDMSDAVGVQQQITTKIREINKIIPKDKSNKDETLKPPSCDSLPVSKFQRQVEQILSQFKSINIENEDLRIDYQVGCGGFGTVCKATRLSTGEVVAVKELRADRLTFGSWASLYAEVETMASVRNQFVLELVGAHITEPYRIITRFCQGRSLFERLHRSKNKLSPTQLTIIAYEVSVGMEHLHSVDIVHRDLKTLNILLDDENDCCVADFGLAGIMKDNQELCGGVGTPNYTAPEVLSHTRYGPKVDSFSFGVVLWEMLLHKIPYDNMRAVAIYEFVVTRGWRLSIPNDTPEGLKKLISRCWSKHPDDRPDFAEIVRLFESNEIYFPGTDLSQIDFPKIKKIRKCPALDLDYVISALKDCNNDHFASVSKFVITNIDEKLKCKLQESKIIESLKDATINLGKVLLLASVVLDDEQITDFFEQGGISIFDQCLKSQADKLISAAVRFALKVPLHLLSQLEKYLPDLFTFLESNESTTNRYIIQFLTRFSFELLTSYKPIIAKCLLHIVSNVEDQKTFDAIVTFLPFCKSIYKIEELRSFYHLLSSNLIVPSSFVQTLIEIDDTEQRPQVIYSILKATATSNISNVFIQFLQKCTPEDLDLVCHLDTFFTTMNELINGTEPSTPLFLLYRIAPNHEAALALADLPLFISLIQMKSYLMQRLSIFTVLCNFEDFCTKMADVDGLLHLLVSSLSDSEFMNGAINLIGSLSSHKVGCRILNDNGVLELFSQLYLNSSYSDDLKTQMILRNLAKNGCIIPQVSLIISCLMQDMMNEQAKKTSILDTLVALVEHYPQSVQEHDLQYIVLRELTDENPLFVLLTLRLFHACDSMHLKNIYPQILVSIHSFLNTSLLLYPEIIEEALEVIKKFHDSFDIQEFIDKSELVRFVNEIIRLLPEQSSRASKFLELIKSIQSR